jgi:asparagine synthase (glutamine-hydrolysing)
MGRNSVEIIEEILRETLGNHRNESVGLLYSGGLDSSIIAKIMISIFPPTSYTVVSVGLPNSYDLNNAAAGAAELGITLHKQFLTIELVLGVISSLKQMNIIHDPVALAISIPIFLGMKILANKFHVNTIFLGQGADELFGGYQKYAQDYEKVGIEATKKRMTRDLRTLMDDQIIRERRFARYFKINSIYPFLDPELMKLTYSFPVTNLFIQTSQGEIVRKVMLRKLANHLGLSKDISTQPKKAIQYGSGTTKLLRNIAKSNNYQNIPEWFEAIFKTKKQL